MAPALLEKGIVLEEEAVSVAKDMYLIVQMFACRLVKKSHLYKIK